MLRLILGEPFSRHDSLTDMRIRSRIALLSLVIAASACGEGDDSGHVTNGESRWRSFVSTSVTEDGKSFDLSAGTVITISFADGNSPQTPAATPSTVATRFKTAYWSPTTSSRPPRWPANEERMDQDQWFIEFLTARPWT